MSPSESPLEVARRHVAEGEQRVMRQEAFIADLARNGQDTAVADALLQTYRRTLEAARAHLANEERHAAHRS